MAIASFCPSPEEAIALAQEFLQQSNLPPKASNDALHMALATAYGLDYLPLATIIIFIKNFLSILAD